MFNCLNSGQPVCFFSLSLLFTPSILVLFFPLGNELKLVLELAVVYSGRKLKKLDEIRLFRTAFNVPFYSFEKDKAKEKDGHVCNMN